MKLVSKSTTFEYKSVYICTLGFTKTKKNQIKLQTKLNRMFELKVVVELAGLVHTKDKEQKIISLLKTVCL